jgi:hypothetical protein
VPVLAFESDVRGSLLDMTLHFPTRAERPGHLPHTGSLGERAIWLEFLYHDQFSNASSAV